jgi:L-2-hydroxyglutarate oxidase LhgO
MIKTDILVVGGGIVGLSILREIFKRHPGLTYTLLEKEDALGRHASGRNSGVLHAGFYYSPESFKARFTVEGNRLLTEYCLERGIAINRCGKVVVAKNEGDLKTLDELERRGRVNGVSLKIVDEKELAEIEPNAKTFGRAIYSPTTSSVNPLDVVNAVGGELLAKNNVKILFGEKFIARSGDNAVTTNRQTIEYGRLINTSGLYADKVAHAFGAGLRYTLVPFKGLYMEYKDPGLLKKHVYPVPDIRNPFLGVHFTVTADGKVKAGPTATPALWRENYAGLSGFSVGEMGDIMFRQARMFLQNSFGFREIAVEEIKKYMRGNFTAQAATLVKNIDIAKFGQYIRPGIRAQLFDTRDMKLVMDFVVEHAGRSTHVLNAVSPAFTCAFTFASHVVDEIEKQG